MQLHECIRQANRMRARWDANMQEVRKTYEGNVLAGKGGDSGYEYIQRMIGVLK
jgi:hypothetical protein